MPDFKRRPPAAGPGGDPELAHEKEWWDSAVRRFLRSSTKWGADFFAQAQEDSYLLVVACIEPHPCQMRRVWLGAVQECRFARFPWPWGWAPLADPRPVAAHARPQH